MLHAHTSVESTGYWTAVVWRMYTCIVQHASAVQKNTNDTQYTSYTHDRQKSTCTYMTHTHSPQIHTQMMRMLLDPENEEQPHEKNAFLELFYGEPMDRLIQPLHDLPPLGSTLHITRTNNNTVPAPHDAVGTSGGGGDAAAGGGDATAPAAAGVVCSNGARSGGAAVNGEQPTAVTTAGAGATAGGTGDNDNKNDNDGGAAPVPSSTTAAAPTSTAKTAAGGVRKVSARTLGVIAELLCFCVQHHGYRVKFYILKNNVVCKV